MPSGALHAAIVGHGPRLVLVHGFTQTGQSWNPVADDLARDHEVLLVDAPGHGGSSAVEADLVRGAQLLGEVGGEAVYVGYSMGGRLALHLALGQPDLVRGLALLGATPGIDDAAARAARQAEDESRALELEHEGVDAFLVRWLAQPLFARLPEGAVGLEDRRRNSARGLASSLRLAGTGAQESLWADLASLRLPVLVVAGSDDVKFAAIGRRMASTIGPWASFSVVPGAGHAAHLERPGEFVRLLRAWLATLDEPRGSPTP